jgi:hypothetical protein
MCSPIIICTAKILPGLQQQVAGGSRGIRPLPPDRLSFDSGFGAFVF